MFSVKQHCHARSSSAPRNIFLLTALPPLGLVFGALIAVVFANTALAQQINKPSGKGGVAELSSAGPQKRQGALTIADGAVDIHYANQRLQADHVEYNEQTNEAVARGHVVFDYQNQHLEASEAHYNVSTGRGTFINVRGTVK